MIMDEQLEFADAVSVAAAAGVAQIGTSVDLTLARDIGQGRPMYVVILTSTEIITGGSAGTIKFQLVSDAQTAINTTNPTTGSVHIDTGTFITDDAAANSAQLNAGGTILFQALPAEGRVYERHLGILATIATTTVTQGAINAFLTFDMHGWKAYADANN